MSSIVDIGGMTNGLYVDNPSTYKPVDFRAAFPAFADIAKYPDAQVNFYLAFAANMADPCRWGALLQNGVFLMTAHFLALTALAGSTQANGIPGTAIGVVSGGTVDKVSYTRDVAAVMEENAGHWGMTMFGLIFLRLQRTVGAGPVQVGVPFGFGSGLPQSASLYNGAWPGPTMTMPYSW